MLLQIARGIRTLSTAIVIMVWPLVAGWAGAATVWNGPSFSFSNLAGSDPTQPSSQDRLTADIWLTRGSTRGLYNAAVEGGYTHSLSPVGTEWAYGELANYAALTYNTWEGWFGGPASGGPPSTVGKDAVLHLIPEDVYLSIQFTSWGVRSGGFSYIRSSPLVPEPASAQMMLAGLAVAAGARYFRRRRIRD